MTKKKKIVKKTTKLKKKKKKMSGGARKGAGRPKGAPHSLINFRILTEKKNKFKKVVKEPNKEFNEWVDVKIKQNTEPDITESKPDPRGVL